MLANLLNTEDDHPVREARTLIDESFASKHPLQILIAEDNLVNQKVISKILGRLGYRVDVASNGLEALEAFSMRLYDVVLMDLHMPEMDGLEATRRILSELEEDEQPVIVAMTAAVMQEDRERCRAAGMKAFVSKPVKIQNLVETLRKIKPRYADPLEEQNIASV